MNNTQITKLLAQPMDQFCEIFEGKSNSIANSEEFEFLNSEYTLCHKIQKIINALLVTATEDKKKLHSQYSIVQDIKINIVNSSFLKLVVPVDIIYNLTAVLKNSSLLFLAIKNAVTKEHLFNILDICGKLTKNFDIHQKDDDQNTFLLLICKNIKRFSRNDSDMPVWYCILEYFLESGVDPNAVDALGNSPLLYLCDVAPPLVTSKSCLSTAVISLSNMMKLLLDKKADINCMNLQGSTPLLVAVRQQSAAIIKLLLDAGADAGVIDPFGQSALQLLCKNTNDAEAIEEAAIQMIKKGAVPDTNLLLLACKMRKNKLAEFLINEGMLLMIKGAGGESPLMIACKYQLHSVIDLLILKAPNLINEHDCNNDNAIFISINNMDVKTLGKLLPKFTQANLLISHHSTQLTIIKAMLTILYNKSFWDPAHEKRAQFENFKVFFDNFMAESFGSVAYAKIFDQNIQQLSDMVLNVPTIFKEFSKYEVSCDISTCFEIALLLKHIPFAKELLCQMGHTTYDKTIQKLKIKYGEKNPDLNNFIQQIEYQISVSHFKTAIDGTVPSRPTGIDLSQFLDLFDKINFTNIDQPFYIEPNFINNIKEVRGLRAYFLNYITKIKNKDPNFGPNEEQRRILFHEKMDTMLCHILQKLQELSKDKDSLPKIGAIIIELIKVPYEAICDIGQQSTVLKIFLRVVRDIPINYPNYIYMLLTDLRQNIIDSLIPIHEQTVHDATRILKAYGPELGLPSATEMNKVHDHYVGNTKLDIAKIKAQFFEKYEDLYAMVAWVKDDLDGSEEHRSLFIDWIRNNITINMQIKSFNKERFDPIQKKVDELKGDQEAIAKYFAEDGIEIIMQGNMKPEEAIEEDRWGLYLAEVIMDSQGKIRAEAIFQSLLLLPTPIIERLSHNTSSEAL